MEPTSRATARDVLKYLYEQGLLTSAYNEETENDIINSVQDIIKKDCDWTSDIGGYYVSKCFSDYTK